MTIVKVQRPLVSTGPHQMWMIYDQLKARIEHCPEKEIPAKVRNHMDSKRGTQTFLKSFWDNAHWKGVDQRWDLSEAKPTQERRW